MDEIEIPLSVLRTDIMKIPVLVVNKYSPYFFRVKGNICEIRVRWCILPLHDPPCDWRRLSVYTIASGLNKFPSRQSRRQGRFKFGQNRARKCTGHWAFTILSISEPHPKELIRYSVQRWAGGLSPVADRGSQEFSFCSKTWMLWMEVSTTWKTYPLILVVRVIAGVRIILHIVRFLAALRTKSKMTSDWNNLIRQAKMGLYPIHAKE